MKNFNQEKFAYKWAMKLYSIFLRVIGVFRSKLIILKLLAVPSQHYVF